MEPAHSELDEQAIFVFLLFRRNKSIEQNNSILLLILYTYTSKEIKRQRETVRSLSCVKKKKQIVIYNSNEKIVADLTERRRWTRIDSTVMKIVINDN